MSTGAAAVCCHSIDAGRPTDSGRARSSFSTPEPTRLSATGAPPGESSTAMTRPNASGPLNTTGGSRTPRPMR